MKKILLTVLGGSLFWVAANTFAGCIACHGPSAKPIKPDADNYQPNMNIPHPIKMPGLQLNVENIRKTVNQKK
jgi:hypothetical protein